jgi:DNA-binding MarR family transcriptional regulator
MPDEVNFIDLVALTRITPDTVAERFGGLINSSFFDASNILATLRQKGLIDFTTSFPGQSAVTITELGKKILTDAATDSQKEFGELDLTILTQLSNGKRTMQDLSGAINVRPTDLAMHLYKLGQQKYLMYDFRNGIVTITLTEKGFIQAKSGMPTPTPQAAQEKTSTVGAPQQLQGVGILPDQFQQAQPVGGVKAAVPASTPPSPTVDINQLEANIKKAKRKRVYGILVLFVAVIVVVAALVIKGVLKY